MNLNYTVSDIQSLLELCLKNEKLTNIVVDSFKCSENDEGIVGDIVFANVRGTASDGASKQYDLVLKCTKRNKLIREMGPEKIFFRNEIYFYETMFPEIRKFQMEREVRDLFECIPKYFGSYMTEDREVIVLENIGASGFKLWNKKKPLTRHHIDLLVKEYAKFHAVSLAMQDQNAEKFVTLIKPFKHLFQEMEKLKGRDDAIKNFLGAVNDVSDILQDEVDASILLKWKSFGKRLQTDFFDLMKNVDGLKVLNHGDTWNNNFMFQNTENKPTKLSILDWQMVNYNTPIADLSSLLFCCISKNDILQMNSILDEYYTYFSKHLMELKSNPEIYPREKFLDDWKQFSKLGIMKVPITMKFCIRDKEQAVDMNTLTESEIFKVFHFDIKDKTCFKDRMKHVVEYVVENNLI